MSTPRNYAAKQHKRVHQFAAVADYSPVHESRSLIAEGSPSLSPPPLQLQSTSDAPKNSGNLPPIGSPPVSGEVASAEASNGELEGTEVAEGKTGETAAGGAPVSAAETPDPGTWDNGAGSEKGPEADPAASANPASCQVEGAVKDWTPEERENLDLGKALRPDLAERLSPECLADTESYARELLEGETCKTTNQGRNGKVTSCEGNLSYGDFPGMMEQIGSDLPTDVQRVAAYNEVADGALESGVDNRDLKPNLIEPALPWESAKHTIVPFDDNYHGRLGGIQGDAKETFNDQPVPSFVDSHEMDWHKGLPEADSMSPGGDHLSHGYSEVLRRESIPPDQDGKFLSNLGNCMNPLSEENCSLDLDILARRIAGGSRQDAEASMSTIENIRDFRKGGWDAFTGGFQDRIVRPPFVRGDRQRGPGHQPRTMPGLGGVFDQLWRN